MKKYYIKIASAWVNTVILPLENAKEHLETYYWDMIKDWCETQEVLKISVVEMSEKDYKKLPEWEP